MAENDKEKERKKDEEDLTKEAFFSDMGSIEEEIATEAIELVKHALSLVDTGFYDDAIEVIRQAIGLYDQINRLEEINALKKKIDEIYILKENSFRERELETISETELTREEELLTKDLEESYKEADSLIVKAIELVNIREFNGALDLYDNAIKILKSLNRSSEVEKINDLIEDCYNRKAEFLREQNIPTSEKTTTHEQESEGELSDLELKALRIRTFEETKRIENEKSTEAYEKIGKATELKNVRQFDESLKLFEESVKLFKEINWTNEVNKIENIIKEVEREKERFLIELQESKEREQQELFNEKQRETQLIERANVEKLIRQQTQAEKLREQVIKKQEETEFQNEISDMINHAEKLAREYDVNMKKGFKKGKLVKKCIYPEVIKIYENVKEKVIEKGWKDQVIICENQIKLYKDLLEKDKKLREIESQKLQKQKDFEDSLKIKQETTTSIEKEDQLTQFKEQRNGEIEVRKFKEYIEKSLKEAEKLAREYDSKFKKAIKAGNLNFDSKYPEIIKVFTEARDRVLEKGLDEEAKIYSTHIRKYTELFDKEKRIREIETKKHEEEKIYEDFKKIKKESFDAEKLRQVEAQKIKEDEERIFQEEIDNLVNKAEKLAREYDIALKKALKEGKFIEESPYSEIIEIYSRIKDRFISKGWNDQVLIYSNQIKIYQEKWENDKKLRELEREKKEKQKIYEESLKVRGEREISHEIVQDFENKQQKQLEDKKFQEEIAELVNKAENLAREYELAMKKALKEGKFIEESPYIEVIEIYTKIRKLMLEKGWTEQGLVYTNQIKVYQEKLDKDKKLREIEDKKKIEQEAFVQAQKVLKTEDTQFDVEKHKKIEELSKLEEEEEKFEREIDKEVDYAEKKARQYELAIKKGEFEKECPYLEIADIYKKIREKVYARGWKDEAEIYGSQVRLYQEKSEKDERLRELEAEKVKKQREFEASLKTIKDPKALRSQELEVISTKDREIEDTTKQAMDLIDEAESAV
ncbi:MAG: hypothetical protein ACFFKA_08390, partial [Candidatus Thorarchaeota archaeon]